MKAPKVKKGQVRTGSPDIFEYIDHDGDKINIAVNKYDEALISITEIIDGEIVRNVSVLLDEEASRAIRFFFNKRFPLRRPYRSEQR